MTNEEKETKLRQQRKLWVLAKSRNNTYLMGKIEEYANKLKTAETEEEATIEQAQELFGVKIET